VKSVQKITNYRPKPRSNHLLLTQIKKSIDEEKQIKLIFSLKGLSQKKLKSFLCEIFKYE